MATNQSRQVEKHRWGLLEYERRITMKRDENMRFSKKLFLLCKIFHEMTIELNFRSVHKNQYWVNKAIEMSRYFKCRFLSIYLFNLSFVRFRLIPPKKEAFIVKVLCSASSGRENFKLIIIIFPSDILTWTWFEIFWILH